MCDVAQGAVQRLLLLGVQGIHLPSYWCAVDALREPGGTLSEVFLGNVLPGDELCRPCCLSAREGCSLQALPLRVRQPTDAQQPVSSSPEPPGRSVPSDGPQPRQASFSSQDRSRPSASPVLLSVFQSHSYTFILNGHTFCRFNRCHCFKLLDSTLLFINYVAKVHTVF